MQPTANRSHRHGEKQIAQHQHAIRFIALRPRGILQSRGYLTDDVNGIMHGN